MQDFNLLSLLIIKNLQVEKYQRLTEIQQYCHTELAKLQFGFK